ncbi:sigma factor-like helix-turn-helix DNA-binding protein [Priestia megaterium]|uniref:sigma factor-like helix-turn-helix DNA-binding protein n=1 Tax=Priestia megaterium TaxID=1404 RepID=UPI0025AF1A1A|nr:sigma factor-like helix-turn-helix DNA-binding protein [Priestia megaterium]MDN3365384.1 sigma factor-like helix-turn-helix DNA-binding protein [Priestia megaterium]
MKDLVIQYEYALTDLRKKDKELKEQQQALESKKRKISDVEELASLIDDIAAIKSERSLYSSMITDMVFEIEWMKTGRRPGSMRGAENLAAYQREISIDPNRFLHMQSIEVESKTDEEIQILEDKVLDLLWFLTKKERTVYMMANGYGHSVEEIAEYTKMASGTIKSILDRCRKKIRKKLKVEDFSA